MYILRASEPFLCGEVSLQQSNDQQQVWREK